MPQARQGRPANHAGACPTAPEAWLNLAWVNRQRGALDAAQHAADKALVTRSPVGPSAPGAGRGRPGPQRSPNAPCGTSRRPWALSPDDAQVLLEAGLANYNQGRVPAAVDLLERALKVRPYPGAGATTTWDFATTSRATSPPPVEDFRCGRGGRSQAMPRRTFQLGTILREDGPKRAGHRGACATPSRRGPTTPTAVFALRRLEPPPARPQNSAFATPFASCVWLPGLIERLPRAGRRSPTFARESTRRDDGQWRDDKIVHGVVCLLGWQGWGPQGVMHYAADGLDARCGTRKAGTRIAARAATQIQEQHARTRPPRRPSPSPPRWWSRPIRWAVFCRASIRTWR